MIATPSATVVAWMCFTILLMAIVFNAARRYQLTPRQVAGVVTLIGISVLFWLLAKAK